MRILANALTSPASANLDMNNFSITNAMDIAANGTISAASISAGMAFFSELSTYTFSPSDISTGSISTGSMYATGYYSPGWSAGATDNFLTNDSRTAYFEGGIFIGAY
jgi:hypothetical protein